MTAAHVREALADVLAEMEREQAALDRLDAVVGDGDHGATMVMGLRAVAAGVAAKPGVTVADVLRTAAHRFASVGGSAGPLWGTALLRAAQSVERADACDLRTMAAAAQAAAAGVAERGGCAVGEKTMLDVMAPAADALAAAAAAGATPAEAVRAARAAASDGLERTRELEPRRGRARLAAGRSRGALDPGAASAEVVWRTAAAAYGRHAGG